MSKEIPAGTYVEISQLVLSAGSRAPQVPEDTAAVPLVLKTRGYLNEPCMPGEEAVITTVLGRQLEGTLEEANPPYRHDFGSPVPELLSVGEEMKEILRKEGKYHASR